MTPVPEWLRKPTDNEIITKAPEGAVQLALDWAKTNTPPPHRETDPRQPWLYLPSTGPNAFETFMTKRGLCATQFAASLTGTNIAPIDLHGAIKRVGVNAAQETLDSRLQEAEKTGTAVHSLIPESRDAKIIQAAAARSPEGFSLALGYVQAQEDKPGTSLEAFLEEKNVAYKAYIGMIGPRSPGDVIQAIRRAPDLAKEITQRVNTPTSSM